LPNHERRIDAAIDGGFFGGVYLENIRARCHSLDVWLDTPGVLMVKFEDLVGAKGKGSDENQRASIKMILDYLDIEKPDAELRDIAGKLHGPGRVTFRKGVIGESQKEMTGGQLRRVDEMLAGVYRRWGYRPLT